MKDFIPHLEFSLDLPRHRHDKFIKGFLTIKKEPDKAGTKLLATSGTQGNQYFKSWLLKGRGCLPPSSALGVSSYTVSTQKLWLPHVKGVEGSFYAISPFSVYLEGVTRGDFGIHFDANVPGSAGCIVLPLQSHWDTFRHTITELRVDGYQSLPLHVKYNYP